MARFSSLLIALFLALSAFGLFQIKFRAQNLTKDVNELKRQLEQERESIHILKAEWAYLNQPHRLKSLADKHLPLKEVKIVQIKKIDKMNSNTIDDIVQQAENMDPQDPNIKPVNIENKKKVKWNFKDKNMSIYSPSGKKLLVSISSD